MEVNARNKQVKVILSKLFGHENVSVKGGRGTAYGWCEVAISAGKRLSDEEFYTEEECALMNGISKRAEAAVLGCEFYKYPDDMGGDNKMLLIQVNLS